MIDDRGSILHPHSFSGIPGSVIRHGFKILANFSGGRTLCGMLDQGESVNERCQRADAADEKILDRPLGLPAVIGRLWDLDLAMESVPNDTFAQPFSLLPLMLQRFPSLEVKAGGASWLARLGEGQTATNAAPTISWLESGVNRLLKSHSESFDRAQDERNGS
jgi:hypothetical protein